MCPGRLRAALNLEEVQFTPHETDHVTNQERTGSGHVTSRYRKWVRTVRNCTFCRELHIKINENKFNIV